MITSEIEYINDQGAPVHSNLVAQDKAITQDQRELLHLALDEWLDKGNQWGHFYVRGESM